MWFIGALGTNYTNSCLPDPRRKSTYLLTTFSNDHHLPFDRVLLCRPQMDMDEMGTDREAKRRGREGAED